MQCLDLHEQLDVFVLAWLKKCPHLVVPDECLDPQHQGSGHRGTGPDHIGVEQRVPDNRPQLLRHGLGQPILVELPELLHEGARGAHQPAGRGGQEVQARLVGPRVVIVVVVVPVPWTGQEPECDAHGGKGQGDAVWGSSKKPHLLHLSLVEAVQGIVCCIQRRQGLVHVRAHVAPASLCRLCERKALGVQGLHHLGAYLRRVPQLPMVLRGGDGQAEI
mmetsp:Transcript_14614/g.51368  ORF Transcript_14614/g.51368 Transcript_14614/m.51368 type:complete len:219 (-) Transcript_14614:1614-2270(-)